MPHFSGTLHSKLPQVGTTIFTVMSQLAQQHNAINLSQGFPDFDCSPELIELVNKAMRDGHNQYAPMPGLMALREVIANKTNLLHGCEYSPETEITITAGGTQAIFTAIASCVKEGDEVIVFEPAYDCYQPAIELAGGLPVFVQLKGPDFRPDWREVEKVFNHRTRLVIINTPHNPTGSCWEQSDFLALEKIMHHSDAILLSDEVYEHLIFDGRKHFSACQFKGLAERSFIIASFGKTFHTTGWKMGYCLAPANLMVEFRKVHQFLVFSANTPVQYALASYLSEAKNYLGLGAFYQAKRDFFLDRIKGSRLTGTAAGGSYFQLLDYSAVSKEKDTVFAQRLVKEFGLAAIPISVFSHEPTPHEFTLRFCFAKKEATLEAAAAIIQKL